MNHPLTTANFDIISTNKAFLINAKLADVLCDFDITFLTYSWTFTFQKIYFYLLQ